METLRLVATNVGLLFLLLISSEIGNCTGLEFSLTNGQPSAPVPSACVLLCREGSLSSARDDSASSIKNLTIFKTVTAGLSSTGDIKLLASVTATNPNMDKVSDGMIFKGSFKDGKAVLKIDLFKQIDCSEEYTCELSEVNAKGEKKVTSSSLLQQPTRKSLNMDSSSLTASVLMRLFALIEQQSVKLESIAKISEKLETEIQAVKVKTEVQNARLEDMKENVNEQRDKLLVMSENFNSFGGINDKLSQFDTKLSLIDSKAKQDTVLQSIETRIDQHFSKALRATDRTEYMLNKTAMLFTSINSQNTNFQRDMDLISHHGLFDNMTRGLNELYVKNNEFTDTLHDVFQSFKEDVDLSWQKLQSSTNESTVQALGALRRVEVDLNATLQSTVRDLFITQTCQKDQGFVFGPSVHPGEYRTHVPGLDTLVLCDTVTNGGGWVVIQRRSPPGVVDFYRNWADYKKGFGSLYTEFWLGNDNIHAITSKGQFELRVHLTYKGRFYYAHYKKFAVAGEDEQYTLTIDGYSGNATDSLKPHNGKKFTTKDRDNDEYKESNCAETYTGAWWYHSSCHHSNLNGKWGGSGYGALTWNFLTAAESVEFSEMKIRQV